MSALGLKYTTSIRSSTVAAFTARTTKNSSAHQRRRFLAYCAPAYLKEISTLKLSPPARSALQHNGDAIMAVSKLGRGTIFAVGDPWLYNEYVDGRKLPPQFENFKAANDLSSWLIQQSAGGSKR